MSSYHHDRSNSIEYNIVVYLLDLDYYINVIIINNIINNHTASNIINFFQL